MNSLHESVVMHQRPAEISADRWSRAHTRVWGLSIEETHDRYWASKGVQVVRPGGAAVIGRGPMLYLLLRRGELVLFKFAPVVKRLNWIRSRAMRLRIVDLDADSYVERVIADDDGGFIAIRRDYSVETHGSTRAAVTGEAKLARQWRDADNAREGWRAIVARAGADRTSVHRCVGRIFDAEDDESLEECLTSLMQRWKNPTLGLDGVYEFMPGVLLHESAEVESGAVLLPPVWIGAGSRIGGQAVVVGPTLTPDEPDAQPTQREVSWERIQYPGWRPTPRLRGRWFRMSKRVFDIGFSLAVLAATAPIYPIAIALIFLEDGWPPFFAHRRQTRRGRTFPCYKFRTMSRGADSMKEELEASNVCDGPQFYIEVDPRVSKVGKWLRRFQIDELPQFWNVLRGHMSVVGPRPSPDSENQYCPAWREARLSIRPGVTGLWQVRRTREPATDFQEWIRYDLEYVQHESWRLDLWIILKTIGKVIKS